MVYFDILHFLHIFSQLAFHLKSLFHITPFYMLQVVASAFAQYYIFVFVIFGVLSLATTGLVYVYFLEINAYMQLFEAILGLLVIKVLTLFSDRIIFGAGGSLRTLSCGPGSPHISLS